MREEGGRDTTTTTTTAQAAVERARASWPTHRIHTQAERTHELFKGFEDQRRVGRRHKGERARLGEGRVHRHRGDGAAAQ